MWRRNFLKLLGLGGASGALACQTRPRESADLTVGSLDLADLEIIDVHVHPPSPTTLADSYATWNGSFVNALLPAYDYEHKEALRGRLSGVFAEHIVNLPRQTGYFNYMARTYGVSPDMEGFDSVVSKGIAGDFTEYIRTILDREKVSHIVLQSRVHLHELGVHLTA